MKRNGNSKHPDTLRGEYDFANLKGRRKGKYAKRYRAANNLVLLAPDVAEAFPTDKAVNEALRTFMRHTRGKLRRTG
jgi:hypothetical protein